MEFQTLRKSHKKEIIIGALAICVIGGALTFATTKAKYKLTQSIDLVKGTINYKPYDFKIMAMYQENDSGTYTEINEMPSSGYLINESKSFCNLTSGSKDTTAILKTIDGNHTIGKLKKNDRCYIYFDKKPLTSEDTLAKLNITNVKTETPDFSQVATTDEGVYSVSDGMYGGTSYYWRGAVTNNYVKFANKCWRIVRINGDGTLRLIYDGTTCHANGENTAESIAILNQRYSLNSSDSSYVGWKYTVGEQFGNQTSSNIMIQSEMWFQSVISEKSAIKVADGFFCNDRVVGTGGKVTTWSASGTPFYYAPLTRARSYNPNLDCQASDDKLLLKVGAITSDEVIMAGGNSGASNALYYLYNNQQYWTMSPRWWGNNFADVFYIDYNGNLNSSYAVTYSFGIRPVINLRSDVTFKSGGTGTQSNPYIVEGAE